MLLAECRMLDCDWTQWISSAEQNELSLHIVRNSYVPGERDTRFLISLHFLRTSILKMSFSLDFCWTALRKWRKSRIPACHCVHVSIVEATYQTRIMMHDDLISASTICLVVLAQYWHMHVAFKLKREFSVTYSSLENISCCFGKQFFNQTQDRKQIWELSRLL